MSAADSPFGPFRLAGLSLRNRVIKAATFEGMTPGAQVSAGLIEHHRELAAGGVAMTTVAYCAVSPDGRTFADQLYMRSEVVPALRRLTDAVHREGAAWADESLGRFGLLTGSADYLELGVLANKHLPELDTHDRFGRRVDLVRFHPAYHQLMRTAIEQGIHASPYADPRPGAHVARAARMYLQSQVEAGHGCPVTMTFAAVPALRNTPALAALWEPKILSAVYDPRNVPDAQKAGLTIGMAMTEKQGGSDVRSNTTRAYPAGAAFGDGPEGDSGYYQQHYCRKAIQQKGEIDIEVANVDPVE